MNAAIHRRQALPFAIFAIVFLAMLVLFVYVVQSNWFARNANVVAIGILLDLAVSAPVIYWLLVRKTGVPPITVIPVSLMGLLFGALLLPDAQQQLVAGFKTVFVPLIELFAIVYLVIVIRRARQALEAEQAFDNKVRIENAMQAIVGNRIIAKIIASEFAMFYYLCRWKSPARNPALLEMPTGAVPFSYHEKNGVTAILFAFGMAIVVEITAVHFLLAMWSHLAAWIATISSVYVLLMILAHARAIRYRPVSVTGAKVHLRNGLLLSADISRELIDHARITRTLEADSSKRNTDVDFAFPGSFNVVISLKQPVEVEKAYGIRQKFDRALVYVDQPEIFVQCVSGDER